MFMCIILLQQIYRMYQRLKKFDIHRYCGDPSLAMVCHVRSVSDLFYDYKVDYYVT